MWRSDLQELVKYMRSIKVKEKMIHYSFFKEILSDIAGARWKSLTDADRRPYVIRSEKLREEHMRRYPDYKYRPKKKPGREIVKLSQINTPVYPKTNTDINQNKQTVKSNQVLPAPSNVPVVKTESPRKVDLNLPELVTSNSPNKPFLTLSRQVGKIGSLSSSAGPFSISPQKGTDSFCHQQTHTAIPLTPPANVPDETASNVCESEFNLSLYDDLLDMIDVKKSQSAVHNDHVIPDWPQVNNAFDMPYSPLSDIIPTPDFHDLYTTPEVNEMLCGQWLDCSLGL